MKEKTKISPSLKERLTEALRERDEASATCIRLIEQVKRLIEKLKDTRMVLAEQEVQAAECLLKEAIRKR